MQAQQSNTASEPGKTNTSFFASIRAAAAAQHQSSASGLQLIAATEGLEGSATQVANVPSLPQDSAQNDETSRQVKAGVLPPLKDQYASHASRGAAAEEQAVAPMSPGLGTAIRMEDRPTTRAVLSRLINPANTDPTWRNPSPSENLLQRGTHPDQPNFVKDSRLGYARPMQSGIQAVDENSLGPSATSTSHNLSREPKSLPEGLAVVQSKRSAQGLQREQSVRAGLAHDAKSLLAALKLYSELLALPGVLSEPHCHYANDLKSLAERSWALVERLIPLEDTANMKWPIVRERTSLVDVLTSCRTLLKTLAAGALEINFGPKAAQPIHVTVESVERILVNLIKNAAEATRERGAIRIKVGIETRHFSSVTQEEPQLLEMMVLSVDDSGCGMTDQQIDELSREQTTLPGQQHGIGLQIVKNLVAASGGTLELRSRIGVGTRVEIVWPLAGNAANTGYLPEDELLGGSFAGVIDRMETVADPAFEPMPDRIASSSDLTDPHPDTGKPFRDERASRWRHERGIAMSGPVDGWRGAIRNLGFAGITTPTNLPDQAKPATLSQGVIAC